MPEIPATRREGDRSLFSVAQIQHVLRTEFNRALRYRYPLVVLVISIDQLGALRDQRGYDAKEVLFEAIVGELRALTRTSDFLGRMADDRLLVVIPHTGAEGGRQLARRLLDRARVLRLPPPLEQESVTLSLGLCGNEHEGLMFHDAQLVAAETAVLEAAAAGGDRCVERAPQGPPGQGPA